MLFIIKVTTNKEDKAIDMISDRAQKKNLNVSALVRPHGLKGYVVLEATDRDSAEEAAFDLPYVKGINQRELCCKLGIMQHSTEIKSFINPLFSSLLSTS